ncbi:MAG: urate oxidase [Actinobacteria bacterium 13_2_20CM_2_72_6]|jgi:urate oxidase|nr:MAG: urate oxidase [Actinobacteria bacterium 13_2_20CM_2_72_6]
MAIVLGANRYGKAETRIVRIARDGARHELTDLNVSVTLAGDLDATHRSGDNANVLPTDSQKNAVYAFAREHGIGEIEDFALRLARHFVDTQPAIDRARVAVDRYGWHRLGDHSFQRDGGPTRTASVSYDGTGAWVVSGVTDLVLLNSTGSEFRGFVQDPYTTLPETGDRILATAVTAHWRHRTATGDWARSHRETQRLLVEAFVDTYSRSLQQTLYAMGQRVLEKRPELVEVRLALPNKHHFLVDLAPFGLDNPGEVYFAADRPYGLIEGTALRDDAPPPGLAWW